ncbi:quinone-dependent dihydroorotate dehydrogenase [Paenibacillus senegalensis]|uniref:quinone-dependent dihydroorotate dehydrogenase n=1 Tax=Paenibacillus senegalensis TaxID=1465766 RepID=UPI0002893CCB|nr:quinone-dependent dihydroorotate dehydrogenase [Paenibacillus senegalensis]
MLYRNGLKKVMFRLDAERAHHITIDGLRRMGKIPGALSVFRGMYAVPLYRELQTKLWDITFDNPLGLAAGLDKNGEAVPAFSSIGFGFMEVGTVTPKPQAGNEKPRLFRLPEDSALINRMGFNNVGAEQMARNLQGNTGRAIPLAINIGKNKVTPNEQAEQDYRECLRLLYPYGDFFVVNISSPNTPDLRNLQHGDELKRLLAAVMDEREIQSRKLQAVKPVLVKIAPDISGSELEYIMDTILASGVSGVIATNTTVSREGLRGAAAAEAGGLSGRPLSGKSSEVIRSVYRLSQGKLPIIGCGGIFSAQDAYDKIRAGASLVEIYTALIYEGPELIKEINEGLLELLRKDGFKRLSDAVGADVL